MFRVNIKPNVKHKAPLEIRNVKPNQQLSRYPIDRGFLHSFTPTQFRALQQQSLAAWWFAAGP
jgi:hypothetical protein